ncbi:hypothetical protein [Flavobacterium sp. UMI-01]|uniref:hypothetical protein n=1 Tax=Flavobacterium sp. UMI-01 TaxID=1441053 RepID=UPI001C7DA863|nr:hypothetical protein [Flavobacterium sp. UMI-01]GIZ09986.1 hypothetical protein FUMI01_27120 [Flavobacterium sp. UMI-01]
MKKVLTEDQLKEKANEVFKQYPKAKQAFATVDGNVFLEKNRAEIHAGKQGTVLTYDRPVPEASESALGNKPAKADDVIKAISEVQTIEELEPFKADIRKSVIKAVEEKTAALLAANA